MNIKDNFSNKKKKTHSLRLSHLFFVFLAGIISLSQEHTLEYIM